MAAWLSGHDGHRIAKAVVMSLGTAVRCAATVVVILVFRV